MFLKISENSQENTCTRVSFLIKLKRLWHRCFLVNFFNRAPPVATSPNRAYLQCASIKALLAFREKWYLKSRDIEFFLQNVLNEIFKIFKMFENNMEFTRAAYWINSKISNRNKNTALIIFLFSHYCCSLLWCNYWKSAKVGSHHQKTLLHLLQWKLFKNYEKMLFTSN